MVAFILTVVVIAISLLIISKLPFLGIEIDSTQKALIAGLIIGVLNGLLGFLLNARLLNMLTLGLSWLILNTLIFGIAAKLVEGFRLRYGVWSAILGGIALSIINSILLSIISKIFPSLA
ncbi:MAG TPA: phage holin family protein [Coleofasciculaceae cyanobacterium]